MRSKKQPSNGMNASIRNHTLAEIVNRSIATPHFAVSAKFLIRPVILYITLQPNMICNEF
jgi:hypothetical protein